MVPVSVHAKDREDRNASLTVHISVGFVHYCLCRRAPLSVSDSFFVQKAEWTDNHQQRTLHVRLTEEADPFFLYQLTLSEEDFQGA